MNHRDSLQQSQEEMMQSLQKELKITRYCSLIAAGLLICVLAGGVYLANCMSPITKAVQEMQPIMEELGKIDVDLLNEKIAQLDMEGLNKAIEGLDTEELSKLLQNINEAAEMLEKVGDGFQSFSDSVSDSFSNLFGSTEDNQL